MPYSSAQEVVESFGQSRSLREVIFYCQKGSTIFPKGTYHFTFGDLPFHEVLEAPQ